MKFMRILPVFALLACSPDEDILKTVDGGLEAARTELASQAYLTTLAESSVDAFSQAVSDAVSADTAAGASVFRPLAEDEAVFNLAGEIELPEGGTLAFVNEDSSLTLRHGQPGKLIVKALQKLVKAKAGKGRFEVEGEINYAADLTYSSGGLYGDMTITGSLALAGDKGEPLQWSALISLTGVRYAITLTLADDAPAILDGAAADLFPIPSIFKKPDPEEEPTQVCGLSLTTDNYVASVTAAQSAFDFIETNDPEAMGSPVSDVTVCFRPATGGGYDVYAARTYDYPIRPVTGSTGPTGTLDPTIHYLSNDFVFYGQAQTTVVVNASGSLLFNAESSLKTYGYLWPWFLDNEYGIVGSSWDARDGYSTYSFLISETANEFVVSASGAGAGGYGGRGDLQMILKLDTNEIIFNYGSYDMFGIAPGIYAGSVYNDSGAYKLVEFIPGTGLGYSPY